MTHAEADPVDHDGGLGPRLSPGPGPGPGPSIRPRRLRGHPALRRLVRETRLGVDDLIWPLFVRGDGGDGGGGGPGAGGAPEPVASMPGVFRHTLASLLPAAEAACAAGVPALLLFGLSDAKDPRGRSAADPAGPVPTALRRLKAEFPDLLLITDVCLCGYTDHGHCGIVENGCIRNDETLPYLAAMALAHAEAGADLVAPSDMMDGRVGAIRAALDGAGHTETGILSYSVKYASAFYGPFRDAAGSAPTFGDRRTHQMDPGNLREALREVELDVAEGADAVMVKPALAYLDVIRAVRERVALPVAAYQVSGEYSMIKAAAERGWVDERAVTLEALGAIKRAGADAIITYHALQAAGWLTETR